MIHMTMPKPRRIHQSNPSLILAFWPNLLYPKSWRQISSAPRTLWRPANKSSWCAKTRRYSTEWRMTSINWPTMSKSKSSKNTSKRGMKRTREISKMTRRIRVLPTGPPIWGLSLYRGQEKQGRWGLAPLMIRVGLRRRERWWRGRLRRGRSIPMTEMVMLNNKDIHEEQRMNSHKIRITIQMRKAIFTNLKASCHLEEVQAQITIESHLNPTKLILLKEMSKIKSKDGPATRHNRMIQQWTKSKSKRTA